MASAVEYFNRFRGGDASIPPKEALLPIAQQLDAAAQSVITEFVAKVEASPEHQARVALLQKQPRTAGKFSDSKVLMSDASSFEQMVAVNDWLQRTHIRDSHTLFFSAPENDYIPVRVQKYSGEFATVMNVTLGVSRGSHKLPRYKIWAEQDPRQDPTQEVFIHPLEVLEVVRQPQFSAATLIKGNAFEEDCIDTKWRYGLECACVESGNQSKPSPKKDRSAGLNACKLVEECSVVGDPRAEEMNVSHSVRYEDYTDDGYQDDLELSVSPGELIQAAETALVDRNAQELKRLIEELAIAMIGVPQAPSFRSYIAGRLTTIA